MKKLFLSLFMITTLVLSVAVCAGSVDVDLLGQDDAKVFLGKLEDFTVTHVEDDYKNTKCSVTIVPTFKIKGKADIDKAIKFADVSFGKIEPKKDEVYFFGVLGKELYVYELENYDNLFDWEKTNYTEGDIVLKERHNSSIAGGIQKLLDDGSFVRAEEERQTFAEKAQENTDVNIQHVVLAVILTVSVLVIMVYRLVKR